jgi:hypothetical protein
MSAIIDFRWDRNVSPRARHKREDVCSALITPNAYLLLIRTKGNPIYLGHI